MLIAYPVLLDFPEPRLKAYTPSTTIAEKFHTIVYLGEANSRMRDFLDIYTLSQNRSFNGGELLAALEATFRRRSMELPSGTPLGLRAGFAALEDKQAQWSAFLRTSELGDSVPSLDRVLVKARDFLMPVANAAGDRGLHSMNWIPGGPWTRLS